MRSVRCKTCQLKCVFKFCIFAAIAFLLLWTFRASIVHTVYYVSDPEYRECVHRRRGYDDMLTPQSQVRDKKTPLYVTLRSHGRLGNWLYAYASLMGIAKANGYIPYISKFHPLTYSFAVSHVRTDDAECLLTVKDPLPCGFSSMFTQLPTGNITIDGYVQSWKYFKDIEKEVRKEFELLPNVLSKSRILYRQEVDKHIQMGRTVISIHARRGDMVWPEAHSLGFHEAPSSYFENAMKYMLKKHPHSVFVVVSDDRAWCLQNIQSPTVKYWMNKDKKRIGNVDVVFGNVQDTLDQPLPGNGVEKRSLTLANQTDNGSNIFLSEQVPMVYFSSPTSEVDFGLLTLANHSIVSVGTFGWWGAWMAGGDVVYHKDYPIKGTKIDREMVKEDFYPPHWVPLSGGNSLQPLGLAVLGRLVITLMATS